MKSKGKVIVAVATLLFLASDPSPVKAEPEEKLKVAINRYSSNHFQRTLAKVDRFVTNRSGGKIKLVFQPDVKARRRIQLARTGQIDIAIVPSHALDIPVFNQEFLLTGPYQIRFVLERLSQQYSKLSGLRYLSAWYNESYGLVARQGLTSVADFNGKILASSSKLPLSGVKRVDLPHGKMAEAFLNNHITVFETPILGAALSKVSQKTNIVFTLTNHRLGSLVFLMNAKRFGSLPEKHRGTLAAAFERFRVPYGEAVVDKEYERLETMKVASADISTYRAAVLKPSITDELKKTEPGKLLKKLAGDPNCPNNQCKCKSSTYGTKCSCDSDCFKQADCKDAS